MKAASYQDRTIPRRARPGSGGTGATGPTYGWFVDYGDRVILTDRAGNTYQPAWVSIVHGGWGFDGEGVEKLPRPRKVNMTTGQVVIEGDRVLINFLEGDPRRPIVTPGFRSVKADAWLAYNHATPGANPNRLRARIRPLNAAGVESGRVSLQVAAEDDGSVQLYASDGIALEVGPNEEGGTAQPLLRLSITNAGVVVDRGGTPERSMLGDTYLGDLNTYMTAMTAFLTTCTGAIDPVVAVAAATLLSSHATFAAKVSASLAPDPGGAPFLSVRLKTE